MSTSTQAEIMNFCAKWRDVVLAQSSDVQSLHTGLTENGEHAAIIVYRSREGKQSFQNLVGQDSELRADLSRVRLHEEIATRSATFQRISTISPTH